MRLSFYPDASVTPPELHLTPETGEERKRLREVLPSHAHFCGDGTAVILRELAGLDLGRLLGEE